MEGEASVSRFRDWAYLPQPAVLLISQSIKSITDYVRFRAVCSPWRSASPSKPHKPLPPQLPWLMLPYAPHREQIDGTADDGTRVLYDLWEAKFRSLRLPEAIGMRCCASHRGWLLFVAEQTSELFLINPVTRARVDLPSFATPVKHIKDVLLGNEGAEHRYRHRYRLHLNPITKATFSSNLTDSGCVVMVFLKDIKNVFYCRVRDRCWTEVFLLELSKELKDVQYHNGIFYIIGTTGIHMVDLSSPTLLGLTRVKIFPDHLKGVDGFFLVGKSGLHMVAVDYSEEEPQDVDDAGSSTRVPKHTVEIHRISNTMTLERVTDTSNTTIFYGDNHHKLALCADDWDVLEGNSMYMEYWSVPAGASFRDPKRYSILFAKLEDAKPKPVLINFGEEPKIWPPPTAMWFQPSFD